MYSVVIPTMWKASETDELLMLYNKCDLVDEIILIDNDVESRNVDLSKYEKIVHIEEKENTFVNPAWNKGVRLSKNKYVVISNDDILFDVDRYLNVIKNFEKPFSFIGLHRASFKRTRDDTNKLYEKSIIKLLDEKIEPGHSVGVGWGCFFVCDKEKWAPIPEKYKVYGGDSWIVDNNTDLYQIHVDITGTWGTTSDHEDFRQIGLMDTLNYQRSKI